MSFGDVRARGIAWTRVYFDYIWAFLMHAPLSTDVPVLLLNQPKSSFSPDLTHKERTKKRKTIINKLNKIKVYTLIAHFQTNYNRVIGFLC